MAQDAGCFQRSARACPWHMLGSEILFLAQKGSRQLDIGEQGNTGQQYKLPRGGFA